MTDVSSEKPAPAPGLTEDVATTPDGVTKEVVDDKYKLPAPKDMTFEVNDSGQVNEVEPASAQSTEQSAVMPVATAVNMETSTDAEAKTESTQAQAPSPEVNNSQVEIENTSSNSSETTADSTSGVEVGEPEEPTYNQPKENLVSLKSQHTIKPKLN